MAFLVHSLLKESADRYPKQIAVVHQGREITYEALDRLSDQLARFLSEQGVRPGDRVGLYLNKSVEAVVAIFGILKAGAAYVPIDPDSPTKRAGYIIENCQMRFVVGSKEKLPQIAEATAASRSVLGVLLVDGEGAASSLSIPLFGWERISALPAVAADVKAERIEDDLAYILYTSGSTGEPKGVMISHRNALTFIDWGHETFAVTCEDRLSNHAPFHFDLSVFDLFVAIKAGAAVILVPAGTNTFPGEVCRFISENRITIWYSVPSVLILILLYGNLQKYSTASLRTVLFAGEVFPVKYLRQLMKALPAAQFYNLYGPTETNVCTFYPVPPLDEERTEPISIGRACANTEVFALNESQQPISGGETGELCARGPAVMKGYWGLPEKSGRVLKPSPLSSHFGETVYHTGDLVMKDADGNYLYVGRKDNMIKCRGYRVEPGEIEAALYSHPAVREAAVIGVQDDQVGNKIKAFISLNDGCTLTGKEVISYCTERIPRYMVPDLIVFHESLPKTSTGKIDRMRLKQSERKDS
jgi:amino acid adenylation domain-containing protein